MHRSAFVEHVYAALGRRDDRAQLGATAAQLGVLLALTTNTITKAVLAITSGPRSYSLRVIAGLALVLVATWTVALVLLLAHR